MTLKKAKYLALHLGLMMESHLGLIIESHLELMMDMSWFPQIALSMVLMMENPWVHFLVFQLDKILELRWVILLVLFLVIQMACLRDQPWQYHLDVLKVNHLAWNKTSY